MVGEVRLFFVVDIPKVNAVMFLRPTESLPPDLHCTDTYLGTANYVKHDGSRPMNIT